MGSRASTVFSGLGEERDGIRRPQNSGSGGWDVVGVAGACTCVCIAYVCGCVYWCWCVHRCVCAVCSVLLWTSAPSLHAFVTHSAHVRAWEPVRALVCSRTCNRPLNRPAGGEPWGLSLTWSQFSPERPSTSSLTFPAGQPTEAGRPAELWHPQGVYRCPVGSDHPAVKHPRVHCPWAG